MRGWLDPGHFALFLVDVIEQLDLSVFEARYSSDCRGRQAIHPQVLLGVVLYGSATGVTSTRALERATHSDVGFRVVAANQQPDHTTISKFLTRHGSELEELFVQVLAMAVEANLVDSSVVAVDGTKLKAAASSSANEAADVLAREFDAWAKKVKENDEREDTDEADRDGSGPIEEVADPARRRDWIRERLDEAARAGGDSRHRVNRTDPDSRLLPIRGGGFVQGYNAQAVAVPSGVVVAADIALNSNDSVVLVDMAQQSCANLAVVGLATPQWLLGDAGYWSSAGVSEVDDDPDLPTCLIPPDRRLPDAAPEPLMVVNGDPEEDAEHHRRVGVFERRAKGEINGNDVACELGISQQQCSSLWKAFQEHGPGALRRKKRPNGGGHRPTPPRAQTVALHAMRTRLANEDMKRRYKQRAATIEPVFAQIKHNRGIRAFRRVTKEKARVDWKIHLTVHNLIRIRNHQFGI
jgi:transposase